VWIDLFRWWLVVEGLGLVALPLTAWFFSRLPDRGYSFAKPLGLLLTGYGAWFVAMLGLAPFGRAVLVVMALLVGGAGCALLGRDGLQRLFGDLRARLGWIGLQEMLFAGALYLGIWLRWYDFFGYGVSIRHTEQPMDLTFLSGILASTQFPPQDPWLSPYPINYYYLGYLLVAVLIRLTGVSVGVGYTLGLATIFALTATGVAGVVRNLIDLSSRDAMPVVRRYTVSRWLLPLFGAMLVLLVGNQVGALQVLAGSEKVVALDPPQLVAAIGNGLGPRATLDLPPPFPAEGNFDSAQLVPQDKVENFNYWWPSRAVWDDLPADEQTRRVYNITEFPLFSFLLGDLHPHVLSLPWTLLAVALALNVLVRPSAPDFRARTGWVQLLLTAIVLGALYAINSWDLPTYLLLYLGALVLLYLRLARTPGTFFWAHFVQQAGATLVASYVVYFPFHLSFVAPTAGFPLGLAPARTGLVEFLVIFGLFAVPLVAYVVHMASSQPTLVNGWPLKTLPTLGLFGLILLFGLALGWPLFVLLPLALWACGLAYTYREQPATVFALWLFALGALVVWGTDVVFLRDHFAGSQPRMNTIFKFYYQVWLLWGMLAAYALWILLRRLRSTSLLWGVPFVVLLAGALVYPRLAPADQAAARELDGLAFLQSQQPAVAAAIEWVRANTATDAVVLQAPGAGYNADSSRIASATGRPTVIGWPGSHEGLWRTGQPTVRAEIDQRIADVTTIYTTMDEQAARMLLDRYNVGFVYVGPLERQLAVEQGAPPEALTKFERWMERKFEQGDVVIYGRR